MDRWGPKHVELNLSAEKNLLIKSTLCILLDCMYIIRWYTVSTVSSYIKVIKVIANIPYQTVP